MRLLFSGLGQAQVVLEGRPLKFATDHGRALLLYLAIEVNRPHSRTSLATLLWPDRPESVALQNLRQALFNLRQSLQAALGDDELLKIDARTVQFQANEAATNLLIEIDVLRFQQTIAACHAHNHPAIERCPVCAERLHEAIALYQGEFLAGFFLNSQLFEEWTAYRRQQLHIQAVTALHVLILYHEGRGDYGQMRQLALRQLTLEAWNEEAHRQLMRAMMGMGDRAGALAQYQLCQRVLREEIDAPPSAETTALYEQILADTYPSLPVSRQVSNQMAQGVTDIAPAIRTAITANAPSLPPAPRDWDQLPRFETLYGREAERHYLQNWLESGHCRVIGVMGMGGVGKTSLVANLLPQVAEHFEVVIWQSLLNALPWEEFLQAWLARLSANQLITLPPTLDKQLALLLTFLRQRPCLLVLDNLESVLPGSPPSSGRDETHAVRQNQATLTEYERLIQFMGEQAHQSTVIFTSRDRPRALSRLEVGITDGAGNAGGNLVNPAAAIQLLVLRGLDVDAGRALLSARQVVGSSADIGHLIDQYSGNPLALRLVVETIHELFEGDVAAFMATGSPVFGDIRAVLNEQWVRLSRLERDILFWFALAREPLTLATLQAHLLEVTNRATLLESIRALHQRTLLERAAFAADHETSTRATPAANAFALQNVVMEFLTEKIIESAFNEIADEKSELLHTHALLNTQSFEHVQQSQRRILLQPLVQRLLAKVGKSRSIAKLRTILAALYANGFVPSYAAGNLLNLLLELDARIDGDNFANLAIRQADLRNAELQRVDFREATFANTLFADAFGPVANMAASPDGTLVAAGTVDAQLRVWKSTTAQLVRSFHGHQGAILAVAFAPSSQLLASGGDDHTIRLWDMQTQVVRVLRGHTDRVFALSFSPDGRFLASSSQDQNVRVWDVERGETSQILLGHRDWVRGVAFSPNGTVVASGSCDHTIGLWNAHTGELLQRLEGHTAWVNALAFTPNGKILASASSDHTVRLWNVESPTQATALETLHSHTLWVWMLAFHPEGRILASAGSDSVIRLWSIDPSLTATRKPATVTHLLRGHADIVQALAFAHGGKILASGGSDQVVLLWDLHQGQIRHAIRGYDLTVRAVTFNASGTLLITGNIQRLIHLWEVASGKLLGTLRGHRGGVGALAVSHNGRLLASAASDRTIRLWQGLEDAARVQPLYELQGHEGEIVGLDFNADDTLLASAAADGTIRLWNVQSGTLRTILRGHRDEVRAVAFSQDGRTVISGSDDTTLCQWDVTSGQMLRVVGQHESSIWFVATSPDGQRVASCSSDQTVRIWDLASNSQEPVAILHGHSARVFAVRYSPDGRWLITASADHTLRIWDAERYTCVQTLRGHRHWVLAAAISPDGSWVASGSPDATIRLWDRVSGREIRQMQPPGPYGGMKIGDATGLTPAQAASLLALGAVE